MIFEKYPEFEEDTAMNVMLSFAFREATMLIRRTGAEIS